MTKSHLMRDICSGSSIHLKQSIDKHRCQTLKNACYLFGHICLDKHAQQQTSLLLGGSHMFWDLRLIVHFVNFIHFPNVKEQRGSDKFKAGSSHFRLILINHFQKNFTSLHFNDFLLKYFLEIIQSPINILSCCMQECTL